MRNATMGKSPAEAIHEGCLLRFRADHDDDDGARLATLPIANLGLGAGGEFPARVSLTVMGPSRDLERHAQIALRVTSPPVLPFDR